MSGMTTTPGAPRTPRFLNSYSVDDEVGETAGAAGARNRQRTHPLGDHRTSMVRNASRSAAAAAAAAESTIISDESNNCGGPSLVCAMSYRGMEVIFATCGSSNRKSSDGDGKNTRVVGLCSRTRVSFQNLLLAEDGAVVVSLVGHPSTGMLLVTTDDGIVRIFHPLPAGVDENSSNSQNPTSLFGRFKWILGNILHCKEVFGLTDISFVRRGAHRSDMSDNELLQHRSHFVDVSVSFNYKVLVAHRDQLALFDATPQCQKSIPLESNNTTTHAPSQPSNANLLWTTRTQSTILHAKIAGDGQAIAVVLEGEGEGIPSPYGVRTYVRDIDDTNHLAYDSTSSHDKASSSPSTPSSHSLLAPVAMSPPPPLPPPQPMYQQSSTAAIHTLSTGIIYKPGPFLVHSAPVTRLSFRGYGTTYSTVSDNETEEWDEYDEGNDLLLTHCRNDNSMRVFGQNSWRQLMHWNTPPGSRADWINGITAANLGDLDAPERKKRSAPAATASSTPKLSNRMSSGNLSDMSGGINKSLLGAQPSASLPAHPLPSSSAGAWIAELTFRQTFPALRLSRLSYMKSGGDDAHPAHFESVAAILPPAALVSTAVLGSGTGDENMSLSLQGVWSAWNPWLHDPNLSSDSDLGDKAGGSGGLSGSAMALLGAAHAGGLGGGRVSAGAFGGGSGAAAQLGGTHAPPSELRIIAAHPGLGGRVCLMEMPLWGDRDFGAMEFGSPLRYLLDLSDGTFQNKKQLKSQQPRQKLSTPPVCIDFESSRLCARVARDRQSVDLTWRKQGSMSIAGLPDEDDAILNRSPSMSSLASTISVDSTVSQTSFDTSCLLESDHPKKYEDQSVMPLPLSLPPLHLPRSASIPGKIGTSKIIQDAISVLYWWPDENFGGPPRLLVLTDSGTLILYEMPPPWSAIEPPMPSYDPFQASASSSLAGSVHTDDGLQCDGSDEDSDNGRESYDVNVTPHPDFGLGLRLEAQAEGMPAVAGCFKKHPLSGGRLPAERTGMIVLGDELLSVNGISLEGMPFDEIITAVRNIGADAKGGSLRMRFRPVNRHVRSLIGSAAGSIGTGLSQTSNRSGGIRRTIEGIIGISPKHSNDALTQNSNTSLAGADAGSANFAQVDVENDEGSYTTLLVGAEVEAQQEFGRIVAMVRDAMPPLSNDTEGVLQDTRPLVLLPWNYGCGAPVLFNSQGATLIVLATGRTLTAARLEVEDDPDPERAHYLTLGSVEVEFQSGTPANNKSNDGGSGIISSITKVKTSGEGWCITTCDSWGNVTLIFIDIVEDVIVTNNSSDKEQEGTKLRANFRQYPIFSCRHANLEKASAVSDSFLLRAASVELFASISHDNGGGSGKEITVWNAVPRVSHSIESNAEDGDCEQAELIQPDDYSSTIVQVIDPELHDENDSVIDFRWVSSGSLDAFPWLVTFTRRSAIVHRRPGRHAHFLPVAEILYPLTTGEFCSTGPDSQSKLYEGSLSPADAFPHLIPALRNIVTASDERKLLRSDWHPESIVAHICTEEEGAKVALRRNIQGMFSWLSRWMRPDETSRPTWNLQYPLGITPLRFVMDNKDIVIDDGENADDGDSASHSAASLMNSLANVTKPKPAPTEEELLLIELQSVLCPGRSSESKSKKDALDRESRAAKRSKEFKLAMAHASVEKNENNSEGEIPPPLQSLRRDEIRFLWAVGELLRNPPKFMKLDPSSQLAYFCVSLMRQLERAKYDEEDDDAQQTPNRPKSISLSNSLSSTIYRPGVLVKQSSFIVSEEVKHPTIASAGCISALLSNSQAQLLSTCCEPGEKMDWSTARSIMLPFWLRSDKHLQKTSEEIAQSIYKREKDIMECALFYIITRNKRSMRNMAATDRSESGIKFLKFVTSYDFTSERGKKAAEKNAYSLLRKRKYMAAATFFLMPEPPMLNTALDVIVTKLKDISLAFFVARLVDNRLFAPAGGGLGGDALTIGGTFSLRSMGGGGGFAGGAMMPGSSSFGELEKMDEIEYKDWNPDITEGARKLLNGHVAKLAKDDTCLESLRLIWLGSRDDASLRLSGCSVKDEEGMIASNDLEVPFSFDTDLTPSKESSTSGAMNRVSVMKQSLAPAASTSSEKSANYRVLTKANALINFCSCPFLLKRIKAQKRVLWSSALLVSRALSRRGIDIPSMRLLLQNTDPSAIEDEPKEDHSVKGTSDIKNGAASSNWGLAVNESKQSSMLESNSASLPGQSKPCITPGDAGNSSIFDSFDVPQPSLKSEGDANKKQTSSIFDSYDMPVPSTKKDKTLAPVKEVNSSIFNSFDPPSIPKQNANDSSRTEPNATGNAANEQMASSIFDSFDAPPQKRTATQTVDSSSGLMSSSIFDSFDAPPQKQTTTKTVGSSSGLMSSSIFDSFDAVPPNTKKQISKTPITPDVSQSNGMSSSIFDSFETTQPKSKHGLARSDQPDCTESSTKSKQTRSHPILPVPKLWVNWRENVLGGSAARRLIREIARTAARFQGDSLVPPMKLFQRHTHPLVPYGAAEVLRRHSEGDAVLKSVRRSLQELCAACRLTEIAVVEQALILLACPNQPRRIVFAVLLYCLMDRADLAEDVIRDAAHNLMSRCESFALANDDLVHNRKTRHYVASQYVRRETSRICWQLELCLWLQRGGTFPLSGIAVRETIVAVRVGLLVASWGRCHDSLENLIKCKPDCVMDHDVGRQLWSSMKMVSYYDERNTNAGGASSSGGWEFLVDCRRDEATNMLRDRKAGSFLIRPHAEDHGVFTLSFRTNLVQIKEKAGANEKPNSSESPGSTNNSTAKPVKKDDVVQHAIIRLSDAGFRCGSFGPFTSLIKLLEAVSSSLPFDLLFGEPPVQGIIKDENIQPSPNSFLLRKLAIQWKTEHYAQRFTENVNNEETVKQSEDSEIVSEIPSDNIVQRQGKSMEAKTELKKRFGMFSQLLILAGIRKQLSAIATAEYENPPVVESSWQNNQSFMSGASSERDKDQNYDVDFEGSLSDSTGDMEDEDMYAIASRILRPLLCWCRTLETAIVHEVMPALPDVATGRTPSLAVAVTASETAIEAAPSERIDGGDAVIRRMIQPGSGVEFRTLKVGEGGNSAMVVLFCRSEAIEYLVSSGAERNETEADARLKRMQKRRVIEQIDLDELIAGKDYSLATNGSESRNETAEVRFRFVDPWEVEALESKEGEVLGASLGRERYLAFNVGIVARSCEEILRSLGGLHLLGLWTHSKGGICLTKAIASVHPPWERDAGGDLEMKRGALAEPSPYTNSIRQHLYRNSLFRHIGMPQRFLALVQVELLDLKNLTSPGGSSSLNAYALLRLKRPGSGAPLTHKARTLDSACTQTRKIGKSTGPNAPASWGSLVRFRFPLPEDVSYDGVCFDREREALFKGAPSVLQISVYEKKFMSDLQLGGADVKLDALTSGGQLEEWVPLRAGKDVISWFARIRLTLRFEILCLDADEADPGIDSERCPSVGLRKIKELSHLGGAHEASKGFKKSVSTPDLLSYFESMVY